MTRQHPEPSLVTNETFGALCARYSRLPSAPAASRTTTTPRREGHSVTPRPLDEVVALGDGF